MARDQSAPAAKARVFWPVLALDVGIGNMRWPTFNVPDIGVSVGSILLAWVLWREYRQSSIERQEGTRTEQRFA